METWYLRDWRAADFAPRIGQIASYPCQIESESWKDPGGYVNGLSRRERVVS